MDNAEYLAKIAAKPKATAGGSISDILSGTVLKLIIGAVAALVLIIGVGTVVNNANTKTLTLYERYYLRIQNLSSEMSPISLYARDLKSTDLRAAAGSLKNSLTVTSQGLAGILGELKVDPMQVSEEATSQEASNLADYTTSLENAKLNGLLDRNFASSTTLQISLLLSMESEILEKTDSDTVTAIVQKSMADLQLLQTRFSELSNSSN